MANSTSDCKRRDAQRRQPLDRCHDGIGTLDWTEVLAPGDLSGRALRFIHDDIVPPGATIGYHRHEHDEEYYYILAGHGEMTLDSRTVAVGPGDITAVFPGGSHALANTGDVPMRILVICVAAKEPRDGRADT